MVWLISFAWNQILSRLHMTCTHSSIKGLGKCLTCSVPHPPATKLLAFIQEIDLWSHSYVLKNFKKSMPVVQNLCSFVSMHHYVSIGILSLPVILTTNIISFLVGVPHEPPIAPLILWFCSNLWYSKGIHPLPPLPRNGLIQVLWRDHDPLIIR